MCDNIVSKEGALAILKALAINNTLTKLSQNLNQTWASILLEMKEWET